MSIKGWLLDKVHGPVARDDDPASRGGVEPTLDAAGNPHDAEGARASQAHLGAYAPLVAAVRDELEHFAAGPLRLHLAIAERDRYVLTSIEVACDESERAAGLLRRFTAEFTPEQIKRFLARDIIAGLRNASAIDLTQFAGLNVEDAAAEPAVEDPYRALIADLKGNAPDAGARAFDVTLVGRWVQGDVSLRPHAATTRAPGTHTPLAARTLTLAIDDARGSSRVDLGSVTPGRRYVIGKDPSCDVVVDGVYASRRHVELWFDHDGWWVADAGSTNGLRVEAGGKVVRSGLHDPARVQALAVAPGGVVVLSAQSEGDPRDHPRVRLDPPPAKSVVSTVRPDAHAPATPLAPARRGSAALALDARMASGVRSVDLGACTLPYSIGRSRSQGLVVDGAHTDVSGRHVEIVEVGEAGASIVVHGDNGVTVAGATHPVGARFVLKPGETMLLGRADARAPACSVSLRMSR